MRDLRWRTLAFTPLVIGALTLGAVPAAAQRGGDGFLFQHPTVSFGLRLGYDRAIAGSDLFDFTTDNLTLSRGSFSSAGWAADMGIWLSPSWDLVLGLGYSGSRSGSEFRDWVDNNNQPIRQVTTFTRMPLSVSAKYYLAPRGREIGRLVWLPSRYAPYLGAGVGVTKYTFRQAGDFVDVNTLRVFADQYESSGWARALHVMGGVEMSMTSHVALAAEARYTWGKAGLSEDFSGFQKLDLSGLAATAGVSLRF